MSLPYGGAVVISIGDTKSLLLESISFTMPMVRPMSFDRSATDRRKEFIPTELYYIWLAKWNLDDYSNPISIEPNIIRSYFIDFYAMAKAFSADETICINGMRKLK